MGDFLTFRKMITPLVIEIIFWIMVAAVVIIGILDLFSGRGTLSVVIGLLEIFLGPVFIRVYCELVILFFRIYDVLREIRDKGKI